MDIPQDVIDALEEVRESGVTNMLARSVVMHEISENGHHAAYLWLHENDRQYMAALMAMGRQRARPKDVELDDQSR